MARVAAADSLAPGEADRRFWPKVRKTSECWVWTGKRRSGYGRFLIKGRAVSAHRVAWELAYGPIPHGKEVCHRCDNPPCVRPDHLFLGDRRANMADAGSKGRMPHGERNHFVAAHRQAGESLCAECRRAEQAYRREQKQKSEVAKNVKAKRREHMREYRQRPDVKAKRREYARKHQAELRQLARLAREAGLDEATE